MKALLILSVLALLAISSELAYHDCLNYGVC